LGGGSFEVVGLTAEIRAACKDLEDAADAAMATPEYANESTALGEVMSAVWTCVQNRGFTVGNDHAGDDHHAAAQAGIQAAFAMCKQLVESDRGVKDVQALP
jgi:hypothetical protein